MAVIAPDEAHARILRSYVDAVKSGKPANRVAAPQGPSTAERVDAAHIRARRALQALDKAIVSVIRLRAELEKADTKAMSAATQPNEAEEERTAIAAHARATGVTVEKQPVPADTSPAKPTLSVEALLQGTEVGVDLGSLFSHSELDLEQNDLQELEKRKT